MLYTLPFLLDRLAGVAVRLLDRCLALAGVVAAAGGLLMCGARSPLVVSGFALVIALVLTRFSLKLGLVAAVLVGVGLVVARNDERLQRITTLEDSEFVSQRIAGAQRGVPGVTDPLPVRGRDGVGGRDEHPVLSGPSGSGTDRVGE